MDLLVVGSCTGEKDVRDCLYLLREADFDDPATLLRREAELSRWALPAVCLYAGWQHRYMMKGLNAIRHFPRLSQLRLSERSAPQSFNPMPARWNHWVDSGAGFIFNN